MTDPQDRSGQAAVDSDAFQEWVAHTAETRGVDKQELLNQLVSAFWVLDEMNGVMGESDGPAGTLDVGAALGDMNPTTKADPATEIPSLGTTDSDDETSVQQETEEGTPEPSTNETATDDGSERIPEVDISEIEQQISQLGSSLSTQLEMIQTVGEIRRQVSDLSLDVENQRSRQDNYTDRIADDLTRMYSQLETLEGRVDELAATDDEALETELRAEIESEVQRLEKSHTEMESWINVEFDEIEGLFEHLLNTADDLDGRVEDVETTVETVAESQTERERVAALREKAIRSGKTEAACADCELPIDLSMLDAPSCPECGAEFADLNTKKGRFGMRSTATLSTDSP